MKFRLTGRHFEITPHLKKHVADKTAKLDKFGDHILDAEITLFKDRVHDMAEGKMRLHNALVAAKGTGPDMYAAVSSLIDKLQVQLKRHEGKLRARKRAVPAKRVPVDSSE